MAQPVVYMIAGPNGAGKTTAAMTLLPNFLNVNEFVNADGIAGGLNPLNPNNEAIAAGRLMLKRIDDLIAAKKSFAFETTGASLVFVKKLKQAKNMGYLSGLVYLWLPLVEFAIDRVKIRVAQGGHSVPEDVIKRRYQRGLKNIWDCYLPLVDHASFFDNTLPSAYLRAIAEKRDGQLKIYRPDIWKTMERSALYGVSNAK